VAKTLVPSDQTLHNWLKAEAAGREIMGKVVSCWDNAVTETLIGSSRANGDCPSEGGTS
jgi:hypothetical protein